MLFSAVWEKEALYGMNLNFFLTMFNLYRLDIKSQIIKQNVVYQFF